MTIIDFMNPEIRQALETKDYTKLQDIWTDLVLDTTASVESFLDICDALKEHGKSDLVVMLLDMLAGHYDTERMYDRAIRVYKHMLLYRKENKVIRQHLIDIYRKQYLHSEHLNKYLELSGVSTGEPILKSLARLDEFLKYDIGTFFYFERYGIGQVVGVNPEKKEIVLDFEKKKRHFLTYRVAQGLLMPLYKDHFLYLKHNDVDSLKTLSESDPNQLVMKLLKDWTEPLSSAQIKTHLDGIIKPSHMSKLWERVRKKLEKDPHIEITGRTTKTYSYAESEVDKEVQARTEFSKAKPHEKYALAENYARTMPELFKEISVDLVDLGNKIYKKDPALALAIMLFSKRYSIPRTFLYTITTLLEENEASILLKKISDPDHQKQVLQAVQDMYPGTWTKMFKRIMLTVNQPKVLDEIVLRLHEYPNILKDTYYTIFSMPKTSPHAYQWMLKTMLAGDLQEYMTPAFIPRLIESLDYVTGIRSLIIKLLSLENFDEIMKHASTDEGQRILETININETLEEYQKNDFIRILKYHFPQMFEEKKETIYTTTQALLKRQAELDRIVNVDIAKNRKEISRAREYGDLSENFEYKSAREKQAQLLEKARIIEQELTIAVVIDAATINTDTVSTGTCVTLVDARDNTIQYTILGRWDTDLTNNIISNEAPAAQNLLGKKVGDTVILQEITYTIKRIEKAL